MPHKPKQNKSPLPSSTGVRRRVAIVVRSRHNRRRYKTLTMLQLQKDRRRSSNLISKNTRRNMRRHKSKMKKRFSDEQIRSLQSVFKSESRPPPQRKQEIAHQLGLEPRQVAVWFQNRRARCKSKQVELDHTILKFSYGSLGSMIDSLERENKSLAAELHRLRNLNEKSKSIYGESRRTGGIVSSRSSEGNAAPPDESGKISGGNYVESREFFEQGCDTYSSAEATDSSQSSSAEGHRLESALGSDCLLEKNCDSEWWEFWS